MNIVDKLKGRVDRFQQRHRFIGFPLAVVKKYGDDEAGHQAALLTYYGFLALFPLLMVLTTTLGVFLRGEGELQRKILKAATEYIPVIGDQLGASVHTLDKAGWALAIGILLTLYGARGVADVFRGAVNHIWEVPYVKRSSFPANLFKSLGIILIGGLGFIAAPVISGYALGIGHLWVFRVLAFLVSALILYGLFIFLIHTAMAEPRPLGEVWLGPLVAALGIVFLQGVGTYLLKHQLHRLQDLYSTFAIVLGLLYWLYLQAQLMMYALEIDAVRSLKLWPRALDQGRLTEADAAAYKLYAERNRWVHDEEIVVRSTSKKRSFFERFQRSENKK